MTKCSHINKHFINIEGVLEDLQCELEEGHGGNHQADYACLRQRDGSVKEAKRIAQANLEGRAIVYMVSGKELIEAVEKAYWSSEAEVPAADIHPDLDQLRELKKSKGEMLDGAVAEAQARQRADAARLAEESARAR